MDLFRVKQLQPVSEVSLKKCLTRFDLVFMGIGAIIGAGIFVLTGIAAATKAGPAIVLSYILAGGASAFAAFCYAELAASIGGAGSAYSYSYASLGEIVAWIIGWDLILEYGFGVCTVAIGWSGYVNDALLSMGIQIPAYLLKGYMEGGLLNLPAFSIVLFLMGIVALGVKQSTNINACIVFIKLLAITVFVLVALFHVNTMNWNPFMPFGWFGVAGGASLVFFAFIGFDAVSTAAEESIHPQRDLPVGILGSLIICTLIYIIVSFLLTGVTSYTSLNIKSPVAETILNLGYRAAAGLIAAGAIAGLTSVILIFIYSLSRIFYAMSRDKLLPSYFVHLHPKTQTPVRIILFTGLLMSLAAGTFSLAEVAELVNIGTLMAFSIVCFGVLFLRHTKPDLPRPFKTPFCPYIPILGILFCVFLMFSLPIITWIRFILWMIIGFIVYFFYSHKNSELSEKT